MSWGGQGQGQGTWGQQPQQGQGTGTWGQPPAQGTGTGTWGQQPQQGQGTGTWGQQGQGQQGQGGWGQQGQGQGQGQGGQQQGQGTQGFNQPVIGGGWTLTAEKTFDVAPGVIDLIGVIPETAREVKFFLDIQSGYCPQERDILITLTTDQDKCKARVHPYKQDAWSVNSQNISLYLGKKVINTKFEGHNPNGGNGQIKLTILGHR